MLLDVSVDLRDKRAKRIHRSSNLGHTSGHKGPSAWNFERSPYGGRHATPQQSRIYLFWTRPVTVSAALSSCDDNSMEHDVAKDNQSTGAFPAVIRAGDSGHRRLASIRSAWTPYMSLNPSVGKLSVEHSHTPRSVASKRYTSV